MNFFYERGSTFGALKGLKELSDHKDIELNENVSTDRNLEESLSRLSSALS